MLEVVEGDVRGVVAEQPEVQPSVRVLTPDGVALPGVEVSWTPAGGDGSATEATITDASGAAVAEWVLGERAGTQRITARLQNGAHVTVEAVAHPGAVVEIVGPSTLMIGVGEQLPAPIHMADAFGNVVPRSRAIWSIESTLVASVDEDGLMSGIAPGSTVLGVDVDGLTEEFPVEVGQSLRLTQIAAGLSHACGLTEAGDAFCWGSNSNGELGAGDVESGNQAIRVDGPEPWRAISLGDRVSCAVSISERGYCWGRRSHSLLGDGVLSPDLNIPESISLDDPIRSLDAGPHHTQCAITTGDEAYCWGHNDFGQVGLGFESSRVLTPQLLPVDGAVRETALSAFHGCALMRSGSTWCWGGGEGLGREVEDPLMASAPAPVAGDREFATLARGIFSTCGVTATGPSFCWGRRGHMHVFAPGTGSLREPTAVGDLDLETLAVGDFHACATLVSGGATCWDSDSLPGPSPLADAVRFAASWLFTCALDGKGTPYCWGDGYGPTPIRIFKRNLN